MDYWGLRNIVERVVPRMGQFGSIAHRGMVKEKGRKKNYFQYDLGAGDYVKKESLLNVDEIKSFVEVSLRSACCPLSLNLDTYDSLLCLHRCKYCFADSFRSTLYTSFFDNSREMGVRSANVNFLCSELDKLMRFRGLKETLSNEVQKAFQLQMPVRFGIRYEDFLWGIEDERKISWEVLRYFQGVSYPVMINTKSDLVGRDDYVRVLSENKGKAAVHMTMISCDESFLSNIEPGAPPFKRRIEACKKLSAAGVKVVARIEPFMVFLNDSQNMVDEYLGHLKNAGVSSLTFDSFSYSARAPGIRENFLELGYDFDRMFLLMSDSQWLGSLLLGKFMEYVRKSGFSCSTFDAGNVVSNDDDACCEVGKWFGGKFCYGNTTSAIRYIKNQGGAPVSWSKYHSFVEENGGFLSESMMFQVKELWNLQGNNSYSIDWAVGLEPYGKDNDGLVWKFTEGADYREEMLQKIL